MSDDPLTLDAGGPYECYLMPGQTIALAALEAKAEGGTPPYTYNWAKYKDCDGTGRRAVAACKEFGVCFFPVTVTDKDGDTAEAEAEVRVGRHSYEP